MIKNILNHYISEQLTLFEKGDRCCQKFCGSFRSSERVLFAEYASNLGLQMRPYIYDGVQAIKVHKKSCRHFMVKVPYLHLQTCTEKELFLLQCQSDFIGSQLEMQMSPEFFSPNSIRPSVPPHRFSLGLKQSMARQNAGGQKSFQEKCALQAHKVRLLNAMRRNRVLVVNGDASLEKSTGLPMYIIENCAEQQAHCKIICVEREQLLAIYNSEQLSVHLGEKVGNTVAFQVHLQSRISEGSNLIYTTSSFLLRVLMGQSVVDSFRHISHIILSDIYRHESFADLLLCELRAALRCHAHLKVVLLSNSRHNKEFIEYFGEGEVLQLQESADADGLYKCPDVWYIDDVRKKLDHECGSNALSFAYSGSPILNRSFRNNSDHLDSLIDDYETTGSEEAFKAFLYMVRGEYASINYRHSQRGSTAIIIAAKLGKFSHLQVLLEMHADPFIMDKQNLNSLTNALTGGNAQCIDMLNSYCAVGQILKDTNPASLDYSLITDLIRILITSPTWAPGNILVLVSDYEQLIRLNFLVLRQKMIGNLPQEVILYMVHSNMEKDQLEAVIEGTPEGINIIIGTDILENVVLQYPCVYVIDCARARCVSYNATTSCKSTRYEWLSKEALTNRSRLVNRYKGVNGTCFRLIPSFLVAQLPAVQKAELLTMPLDRICLTVKLLSQHTMVAEYLQHTIVRPPFIHVHHTVEYLKKINVFDEFEEVTWLGCRLIDVPIDCQLGKLLVFAILLQCLDPVLTIVSFLSTSDPLELPSDINGLGQPQVDIIRYKMKQERKRFAEGISSDHLIYLRMYQEWQNNLRDDNPDMSLSDEHHYVLNGILERVCDMRTHLVGALRSSQLIHNQGQLSMHYINLKSNSWPMIKATLVAGLYPFVCVFDISEGKLKSSRARGLVLHPSSTLRDLIIEPLSILAQKFPSPWIIYGDEINSINYNSIKCCTLVSPVAIAVFAGPTKINPSSLIIENTIDKHSLSTSRNYINSKLFTSTLYIDDCIEFRMKSSEAQLLLKTRQYFYCTYIHFLQNCVNIDKWRRSTISLSQISRLFDALEKVFTYEDNACGFSKPSNVGLRPKAVPNKFISTFNSVMSWEKLPTMRKFKAKYVSCSPKVDVHNFGHICKYSCLEKQYFLACISEAVDTSIRKYSYDWLLESVTKAVGPYLAPDMMTFVITYSKTPEQFCMVALAKRVFGIVKLQEFFKNKIPIHELLIICSKHNICVPSFNEKCTPFQVDSLLGKPQHIYVCNISTLVGKHLDYAFEYIKK